MTLDYTKIFLIVTEEAVVKGHFIRITDCKFVANTRCKLWAIGWWLGIVTVPKSGAVFLLPCEVSFPVI